MQEIHKIRATREGLVGGTTASGYVVDTVVPFVSLPARLALGRFVLVYNPLTAMRCFAVVLDVGPWNVEDDAYVFGSSRPQAESGVDLSGRPTNGSGIDLGEAVWKSLGMADNTEVVWFFLSI